MQITAASAGKNPLPLEGEGWGGGAQNGAPIYTAPLLTSPIKGGGKILIIVQNLPVPFDRRVWQEATTLVANGYEVSVICPKGRGFELAYECLDGVHIYRHPLPLEAHGALGYLLEYSSSLFWEFLLAWKVLFTRGFDAIHACNPPDNIFFIGGFFKCCLGKKFLFDHHDINPELYEAKFNRRDFFYKVMLLWERLTFRLADVSIATNESYKKIAIERGGMNPDKVFVVRSGPSLRRMKIIPPVPELKMGKKFLVGYVGVMGQQEGIHYLIEAARIIVHDMKRDDVHFTLAGGGPALEDLKKLAAEKGVGEAMTFTGRIPDQELLEVLNTTDLCVNPDEVNPMNDKSTMNKIMEYMALAKPIVQFDVTEGRFSAQEASLYAKPNDASDLAQKIVELLDDPAKREAMGRFGRLRVENELAWPYEIPKLLAAYDALFARPRTSFHARLLWYRHRIAAMSPSEILHRAWEMAKRRHDGYRSYVFVPIPHDLGPLPQIPALKDQFQNWQVPDRLIAAWEETARQAQSGRFVLLGQSWPGCPREKKWHLDPVSGGSWPQDKFCFSIDYRHASGKGDVKYVWELGRLQYLQPVAALAYLRQDAALAKFALKDIEDWIDQNPPHSGVHWASGIELALRVVSILVVVTWVGEHLDSAARAKIWGTLAAHARWIERYPSKYSSANNHRTAEGLGLFMIGALCTPLSDAPRWKMQGWEMLCETARLQILPDGVGAEQAVAYEAVVLEMLMLGLHVARAAQVSVPEYYERKIARAGEFLRWLTDAGGNQPRIGDDDNACVLWRNDEHYVRSILGCVAAVTARADVTPPLYEPSLRNLVFGLPPAAGEMLQGVRIFGDGGYTVGRHGDILLVMDHGPLGYLSIAAHGHADALAVWLHIGNQPVLVDAGTYLYHSGGDWRTHFRGTSAHNTLCLEGADSSVMSGNFNWSRKARTMLTASEIRPDDWWIEAEHDGYLRMLGATHRRRLTVAPGDGFTLEDALTGHAPRHTEIAFLFHPALSATVQEEGIVICKGEHILLRLRHDGLPEMTVDTGWYSPSFGEKIPAPRVVFSGLLAPGQKAVTRFSLVQAHG